jgi:ribonucleoside-diphosphate reductase alpha chain
MTTRRSIDPVFLRPNALAVLRARYLKRDPETGEPCESPEELLARVARSVADVEGRSGRPRSEVERLEEEYFELMASGRFLPNSPTLMNAGRELGMLSACFVLPVEDSIEGIFETLKETALIQKAGGGTGFAFSRLRPAGDLVRSSGGTTSGPLSFLRVYSEATNAIQQGAFRRGANMGILEITHPDIIDFIKAKDDLQSLTNYNLSVAIPDEFMKRLLEDPGAPHEVINPRTGEKRVLERRVLPGGQRRQWTAGEVFDLIAERAWGSGEPGVVFIDRINDANPTPRLGRIEATNPCSEQPLLPFEACTLGSINVARFAGGGERPDEIDWAALGRAIRLAVRFLDDVIDAGRYPVPRIEAMALGNRKIGLGIMGFADLLYLLGLAYDSEEGCAMGEKLMAYLQREAHQASEGLAAERGSFPNWEGSIWDEKHHRPMRNAAVTTIAPTGTLSILAGCSGGIEPLFSLAFYRQVLGGQKLLEVNEIFLSEARKRAFYSDDLIEQLVREGSLRNISGIPEEVKRIFVTARDIAPEWHIRMQAAFQRHCDSGISKTINFPAGAAVDEVRRIFLLAHAEGLKGVTVYRDRARLQQPMALAEEAAPAAAASASEVEAPPEIRCPRCSGRLRFLEGCARCPHCGFVQC